MDVYNTSIQEKQIVKYCVGKKTFDNKTAAQNYAKKLERLNSEYLSVQDPAEALLKLLDNEVAKIIAPWYKKKFDDFRKIIAQKQPCDCEVAMIIAMKEGSSRDKDIITDTFIKLSTEYSRVYTTNLFQTV